MSDKIKIGKHVFNTLVAITEEEHAIGLMWKKAPAPIMSFPYEKAEVHKFWMQNTIAPLDILFCHGNKIIDIKKGSPYSIDLIGPDKETDLVVELPFGTVKEYNIAEGDYIELKYSMNTLSKKYAQKLNVRT